MLGTPIGTLDYIRAEKGILIDTLNLLILLGAEGGNRTRTSTRDTGFSYQLRLSPLTF
jgi:hypothetical protein